MNRWQIACLANCLFTDVHIRSSSLGAHLKTSAQRIASPEFRDYSKRDRRDQDLAITPTIRMASIYRLWRDD